MATDNVPTADVVDEVLREDEALFSRSIVDGQLIRFEEATSDDFQTDVTLVIDGRPVTVKAAVPATDSQGNILNDANGVPVPRRTTIFDAARLVFGGAANPIPVICHQDHMPPVGVCRVCLVEIHQERKGRKVVQLVPSCTRRVEPDMVVHTVGTPDTAAKERIESNVRVVTELLVADHQKARMATRAYGDNELQTLANRFLGEQSPRFRTNPKPRGRDYSSPVISIDHSACILCDRCVRACNEVKQNHVIGRSGKGYTAQIAFDLGSPMGESSCVSCGECMVSCPTDALTFHDVVREINPRETPEADEFPSVLELLQMPLFSALPPKFLEWNSGAVRRRRLNEGETLCQEGEYGSTAFVLVKGEFEVFATRKEETPQAAPKRKGWLSGFFSGPKVPARTGGAQRSLGRLTPDDMLVGEMTCLNNYPRTATIVARTPGEVLEINRNVLYYLQRKPESRAALQKVYNVRALRSQLEMIPFFKELGESERAVATDFLRERIEIVHVDPGQIVFREGDPADDLYIVRLGYVKISRGEPGNEVAIDYFGPNRQFGEIGVLTNRRGLQGANDPVRALYDQLRGLIPPETCGLRTATCAALDHVELVRIAGDDLRALVRKEPHLAETLANYVNGLFTQRSPDKVERQAPLNSFLDQGLYHGQKLLVLDLESCTRCDECARACADTHGGETRLIREGMRYDRFLIASACRSCKDPYCLVGCPVDAIHRVSTPDRPGALEIVIDNHCIGCGLCANNCPYGNISMRDRPAAGQAAPRGDGSGLTVARQATVCDLCRDIVSPDEDPSCVYACPHHAAFRMTGDQLLDVVEGRMTLSELLHD
jgi:CRP-like cAMP-binding protein/Fe-S-cluster-containing dehydrogenase component